MERVIAAWNKEAGKFVVREASITGMGDVTGDTPDQFNNAVQEAFPEGSEIMVEYPGTDVPVLIGPKPH